MKSLYKLFLTIVIGSAVFVGGFFLYHNDIQNKSKIDENIQGDFLLPNNIEMIEDEDDGVVVLLNKIDGYSVKLKKPSKVNYQAGMLEVDYDLVVEESSEGGGYRPSVNIITEYTTSSVKSWVERWISSSDDPSYYSYEKRVINGSDIYFIVDKVFFGGPKYYPVFKKGERIFFVEGFFVDTNKILESIDLL